MWRRNDAFILGSMTVRVMDPGEGVCADPVKGGAILGKGGTGPQRREQGASVEPGQGQGQDVICGEMRRRQEDEEDDPFMTSRCQHAQSELMCTARGWKWMCWWCIYSCTYCTYCFRKINQLVPVPFVFILWCKKPCREQYGYEHALPFFIRCKAATRN
jgi:hypothetical protein